MFYNNKSMIIIKTKRQNVVVVVVASTQLFELTHAKIAKHNDEKNTRKNICPISREWSCRISAISIDDSPTFISASPTNNKQR